MFYMMYVSHHVTYSEHEVLQEQMTSLQSVKERLQQKILHLEEELKKAKDLETRNQQNREEDEVISCGQEEECSYIT